MFKKYKELMGKKEDTDALEKSKEFLKSKVRKFTTPYKSLVSEKSVVIRETEKPKSAKAISEPNFLIKLSTMVKKDLKMLLRTRTSALIVLLGPLLTIFLVGMAFNTSSLYNLKIGTYSESYSELTNTIIDDLTDKQYAVVKLDSEINCIEGVKLADHHVCVIFPKDMKIENTVDNIIIFYVDESRLNLASLISNTILKKISSISTELSLGYTTTLIDTINLAQKEAEQDDSLISSLKTSNVDVKTKLKTVEDDFNALDLDINESELNFTSINDEISNLKEKLNVSSSAFKDLDDALNDIKLGVAVIKDKLSSAQQTRLGSVNELNSLKEKLSGDLNSLNTIKNSIVSIKASINSLELTSAEAIVSPIKTDVKPLTKQKTHLSYLFPTLVILVIMFISILLSSSIVIREKTSTAYFRNFITPTSDILFMFGTYLTNIILVLVQLGVLLLVTLFFYAELEGVLLNASIIILVAASVFISLGMLIGYIFKTDETSTLGAIAISSLMLFFSNTILPLESLPLAVRNIAKFNPFVISESLLKKVVLFNTNLDVLANPIYTLLIFTLIFFALAFIARELTKRSLS